MKEGSCYLFYLLANPIKLPSVRFHENSFDSSQVVSCVSMEGQSDFMGTLQGYECP
jgi:hypothetical protein